MRGLKATKQNGARGSKKAFSLAELLVVIIIASIVGGTAVTVLGLVFGMFGQLNDYMAGREEIEFVIQSIGREITNIGLGMPNNRQGRGSFASAFHTGPSAPVMAQMGAPGQSWGGPVTLGVKNPGDLYTSAQMVTAMTTAGSKTFYQGPELYYAWAVPTGIKASLRGEEGTIRNDQDLVLDVHPHDGSRSGLDVLRNFRYDGRNIGIVADGGRNLSSWILFPSLRLPMLITGIDESAAQLKVRVAPGSPQALSAPFMGLDEVFLLQVARLYRNDRNEMVQLVFGSDYTNPATTTKKILAHNIVGLHFTSDPTLRLLTMHIAAQGEEARSGADAAGWPAFAEPLPKGRRFVVEQADWRIRN
jgi:hypothetical protein